MSRLVAQKPEAKLGPKPKTELKDRLERVAKFIPGEVVAVYMFFNGIITMEPRHQWRVGYYAVTFLFCLVVTPLYLRKMAKPGDDVPRQQIISSIAFLFWSYALGVGVFVELGIYLPVLAAILVGMFSFATLFL